MSPPNAKRAGDRDDFLRHADVGVRRRRVATRMLWITEQKRPSEGLLRVIRARVEPAVAPAMSAIAPFATKKRCAAEATRRAKSRRAVSHKRKSVARA